MEKLKGKSILKKIAIGKIRCFSREKRGDKRIYVKDADAELRRFENAREKALEQLHALYEKAKNEVGDEDASVFEIHAMILADGRFSDSVRTMIRTENTDAEFAVSSAGKRYAEVFHNMDDEYMRGRAEDIMDISRRVISCLRGEKEQKISGGEPVILAAADLMPSETVRMDRSKLLGLVTEYGSSGSHTAILARSMDIPALMGIPVNQSMDGKMAVLDGISGVLILDPDEKTLKDYREKMRLEGRRRELLRQLKGKEDVTLDGKKILLYANIGNIDDVSQVLENDAGGIGLFRSEFLYLEKTDYPSEEEQFQVYRTVAQDMKGKKVIIRTLDIGADKQADYFGLEHEENPAMGYRGIRICLEREDMFKVQLRAILRASAFGKIGIMYPMIISIDEVKRCKTLLAEAREELIRKKVPVGEVEQGIMIETPAAVMISDLLAQEVDFFSIGTNDLTQYTLAADRRNARLDSIYDARHPAVLRMIRMTVENGHRNGCWVGICGELGADTELTEKFLKMGVDELSVTPSCILPIRKIIRESAAK